MAPSCKYGLTLAWVSISGISATIGTLLGLDAMVVASFAAVMCVELLSGLWASQVTNTPFSSMRFSRFCFKAFYYIIIIWFFNNLSVNYAHRGQKIAAEIFLYLHMFFVIQIACENCISILENAAVIEGKEKDHYIKRIKSVLSNKLK